MFGSPTPLGANEAEIADRVLDEDVAFVGGHMGGELGPELHRGLWGVNATHGALQRQSQQGVGGAEGPVGSADGVVGGVSLEGRGLRVGRAQVPLREATAHGYTSIYGMVGC